jgi:FkbM family methyltransferase
MSTIDILERAIYAFRGRHFFGKGRLLRLLSPTNGDRIVRIAPETKIRLCLDDHLQRLMYMDILHHDWLPLLPTLLKPGGSFVDIGANIGYFSLIAAGLVGKNGQVIAIEPIPRTHDLLRANIELNGFTQVRAEQYALGTSIGSLELHLPPPEAHRDYLVTGLEIPGWSSLAVQCTTIDEAFSSWKMPRIDLIKIDVEGSEPQVISGGRSVLSSGRVRALICEISGVHLARWNMSSQTIIDDLASLGFRHARLGRNGRIIPQPAPRMLLDHDYNLIFIHESF